MDTRTAVVTGASSGIGEATARHLAKAGFSVVVGARRIDRLEALAKEIGATAHPLDVTDQSSVDEFCTHIENCDVLVNNAGAAFGVETVAEAIDEKWQKTFEVNVMGSMRMTRALLPKLISSQNGHVVNVTSVAAVETYPGGSAYNAAKYAEHALTDVLRQELLGQPVRVTEILPGAVRTEFSMVRYDGDLDAFERVYEGMTPLSADDVADVIAFTVTRPSHVNLAEVVIYPRDQAKVRMIHRTQ